ncbi:ChbG/HpnK family deacetylase [Mucilaginibacter psychrotolerans]|uniref:ChbG/HpnK family deacetylase n=1 Tax=Mucilaginibacter psychrotolerans TaxID=1524096 RepID=A0A4Y8SI62_9SPHI|nr:ChbG/HpnK family deacetylase [Mucilaginibacter psychrotolerans]TFF38783.1 ChbG/HpnK family deacetylase [Mucilaginibacter psychrotolerans]
MPLNSNIIANADDFGLNASVNKAILFCFEKEYINSATLLTNTPGFEEAVQIIEDNSCIINVGVHVNLADCRPLTNVPARLLNADGTWSLEQTNNIFARFSRQEQKALLQEIHAQINNALQHGVPVSHIDSHYHLHTLPSLNGLFLQAARHYQLKLRLAQTYREGSYLKYWYRKYINQKLIDNGLNYTHKFETVALFLANVQARPAGEKVEVMLHPTFDAAGDLTDHFDKPTMQNWINYIRQLQNV